MDTPLPIPAEEPSWVGCKESQQGQAVQICAFKILYKKGNVHIPCSLKVGENKGK